MKTYSETRGEMPFNWTEWLTKQEALVKDNQLLDSLEWGEAQKRAKSWVTCACGNQCAVIPRKDDGEPIDTVLLKLGGNQGFYNAIYNLNPTAALHFLSLIEQHSAYLINQEIVKADARRREVLELAGRPL